MFKIYILDFLKKYFLYRANYKQFNKIYIIKPLTIIEVKNCLILRNMIYKVCCYTSAFFVTLNIYILEVCNGCLIRKYLLIIKTKSNYSLLNTLTFDKNKNKTLKFSNCVNYFHLDKFNLFIHKRRPYKCDIYVAVKLSIFF